MQLEGTPASLLRPVKPPSTALKRLTLEGVNTQALLEASLGLSSFIRLLDSVLHHFLPHAAPCMAPASIRKTAFENPSALLLAMVSVYVRTQ